jgi:hypothetical protein
MWTVAPISLSAPYQKLVGVGHKIKEREISSTSASMAIGMSRI